MPKFEHQALERPSGQIRLLQLEPCVGPTELRLSVATYDLDNCPAYNALSYEWGDPEPTVDILVNGKAFDICHNLSLFLGELERKRTQGLQNHLLLWADAICIDQTNLMERNAQVSLMGTIYQNAMRVFAWLGWP
jgi:Heterokaryon incompatibility protein (HET)